MSELSSIAATIEKLNILLDKLSAELETCSNLKSTVELPAKTDADDQMFEQIKAELDRLKEELRKQVAEEGRFSKQVLELNEKLDRTLNKYYWLWQKCKGANHFKHEDFEF